MSEEKKSTTTNLPVGEVLQESWDLFVKNINVFIIVVLIGIGLYLIPAIIGWIGGFAFVSTGSLVALSGSGSSSLIWGSLLGALGFSFVMLILGLLISTVYLAATNYAVYHVVSGKTVDAWDNFKLGFKKFWTFLGMAICVGLIVGIGLLLLVVPGLIAGFFLSFSFYLLVVEDLTISKAISRSFALVKENWFLILILSLIIMAINALLGMIPFIGLIAGPFAALFGTLVLAVVYKRVK
jgi:uncharacterized membrane protein